MVMTNIKEIFGISIISNGQTPGDMPQGKGNSVETQHTSGYRTQ